MTYILLFLLTFNVLLTLTIYVGAAAPVPKRKSRSKEGICGCTHHYSFHGSGGCKYRLGNFYRDECGCQEFVGTPPPIEQMSHNIQRELM